MIRDFSDGALDLLARINGCPNFSACRDMPDRPHPCRAVVQSQRAFFPNDSSLFQTPEPWRGHLTTASLLFISSNPSIGDPSLNPREVYPTLGWSEAAIADFFGNSFGGGVRPWIGDGKRALLSDGSHGPAVRFWSEVRARAVELFERPVTPGSDYALTEVVHCKSRGEIGVFDAAHECSGRYLAPILQASQARVVVILGATAAIAVRRWWASTGATTVEPSSRCVIGPPMATGHSRVFVFSPHPNARTSRRLPVVLTADELERARAPLRSALGKAAGIT